jgi:hypothetical protein
LFAEVGVKPGVGMFNLGLSLNGLGDNFKLILVDFSVTEHQLAEFVGLLIVFVRSDFINPKTHCLCAILALLGIVLVLLFFFFELHDHLIFLLSKSEIVLLLFVGTVVRYLVHVILLFLGIEGLGSLVKLQLWLN